MTTSVLKRAREKTYHARLHVFHFHHCHTEVAIKTISKYGKYYSVNEPTLLFCVFFFLLSVSGNIKSMQRLKAVS